MQMTRQCCETIVTNNPDASSISVTIRERKSKFVRLFNKTPKEVHCPHFYELILSNGCPYDCSYCYLRLTFRGNKKPVLFCNEWTQVKRELDIVPEGVFSTGELADSLAIMPPLLIDTLGYFVNQETRYLLLTTKSSNIGLLRKMKPNKQIIISFSVNSYSAANRFEHLAPPPNVRLKAARELISRGWRVRIRLDPIILEAGLDDYRPLCEHLKKLGPERITLGMLRQYPGLYRFSPHAPRQGLFKASDGRMRYPPEIRASVYMQLADWLEQEPALCKETTDVWKYLGWESGGCNCTL